jgi:hypothetical protein
MTNADLSESATDAAARTGLSAGRRGALRVAHLLGLLTLAAITVQVGFAGLGAFGASFDAHRALGMVIPALTLLIVIAMLVARPGARDVLMTVALIVLSVLQVVLGGLGDTSSEWFGAVHALNALALLGLTGRIVAQAGRSLRSPAPSGRTA